MSTTAATERAALAKATQMTTEEPVMCYAARYPGKPGFGAIYVDKRTHRREMSNEVLEWVKEGAAVEHVTLEQGQAGLSEYIAARHKARIACDVMKTP